MVAGRPWYQRNPADFLMATAHYDLEIKGAYAILLDLLNDRDRPIPDEDRFIAGQLGCSRQRWRKIRARLIADHKLVETGDGYLTNPRFERERAVRNGDHEQAKLWGRAGGLISAARRAGQTELDLDAGWDEAHPGPARARTESGQTDDKVATKPPTKSQQSRNLSASKSQKPNEKPKEINPPAQDPPQAPCAREESRVKRIDSSHPTLESGRLDDADLVALTQAVCEAAGYRPVSPGQIDRATAQVEEWRAQQISFDDLIIPTIEALMAKSTEPTRTLGRFKAPIAHEFAKARALAKAGKRHRPPDKPLLAPDDEDELFRPVRAQLLEAIGPASFCISANRVRFRDIRADGWERNPMRVEGDGYAVEALSRGAHAKLLRQIAKAHGFDEVWA